MKHWYRPLLLGLLCAGPALAQNKLQEQLKPYIDKDYPALDALYKHLHAHPELSFMEEKTAALVAKELRQAGFEVTEKFGGNGVVGVLRNGPGKTLLIRADMDALPMKEETGLPYASQAIVKDSEGKDSPAMHACGHDVHMSVLVGTARALAVLKNQWKGTLILVGQPAEEKVGGAVAMTDAGLYQKFGQPDYCLSLHASANLPAGKVGYCPEYSMANVNSVDITVYGIGGHGAYPHLTKDPVLLASNIVVALQSIVSREVPALDAVVLTVGSIHGGSKHNIIPNEVKLQLTLRTYTPQMRDMALASIARIARGMGIAAGLPDDKLPKVEISNEAAEALYNDPPLTARVAESLKRALGPERVAQVQPVMAAEDFGIFGKKGRSPIPVCMFWLGTVKPELVAQSEATGAVLPPLHSSKFAPVPEPSIKTGVQSMVQAAVDLFSHK